MRSWISVDDQLPEPVTDVWATDGYKVEVGFRSFVDTDKTHWVDFHFPVTHWMQCDDENEQAPKPPISQ